MGTDVMVVENEFIGRDEILRFHDTKTGRMEIHLHSLGRIAIEYGNDPLKRLDEAMAWIVEKAHRRLDAVARSL